jgi:hypothetical protein
VTVLLLMPGDPLRPQRVDPHFAPEAAAARAAGDQVVVVDHDALTTPGAAAAAVAALPVNRKPLSTAIYRGWMLRSEEYADFAAALALRGVTLQTSPEQYRQAHELPGWYPALVGLTPPSAWTAGSARADFDRCRRQLGSGPVVLRDYSKSMKHYWDEAALIPEIAAADAAWQVATRFLELREDAFVGGFVLRRFEDFDSAEVRTWWVHGRCVLVGAHPDTPGQTPAVDLDLTAVTPVIAELALPFVTVDLAHRFDGTWRVIELGDGQVSDRPADLDPALLIAAVSMEASTGRTPTVAAVGSPRPATAPPED